MFSVTLLGANPTQCTHDCPETKTTAIEHSICFSQLWKSAPAPAICSHQVCQYPVIKQLCEQHRINCIAWLTDIQTRLQLSSYWGPGDLDVPVASQDYLLHLHDLCALPWLGVRDVTDHNLRDMDVSTVTGRDLMWRDPKRSWPLGVLTIFRSNS